MRNLIASAALLAVVATAAVAYAGHYPLCPQTVHSASGTTLVNTDCSGNVTASGNVSTSGIFITDGGIKFSDGTILTTGASSGNAVTPYIAADGGFQLVLHDLDIADNTSNGYGTGITHSFGVNYSGSTFTLKDRNNGGQSNTILYGGASNGSNKSGWAVNSTLLQAGSGCGSLQVVKTGNEAAGWYVNLGTATAPTFYLCGRTFNGPTTMPDAFTLRGDGLLTTASTMSSGSASGSDAFAVLHNGGRVHFGTGASDYASSDGTTVTFASPVVVAAGSTATAAAQLGQVEATFGVYIDPTSSPEVSPPWLSPATGATVVAVGYSYLHDGTDDVDSAGVTWSIVDHTNADTVLCTGNITCHDGSGSTGLITTCTATLPAGHQIEIGTSPNCGTSGVRPGIQWQVQASF